MSSSFSEVRTAWSPHKHWSDTKFTQGVQRAVEGSCQNCYLVTAWPSCPSQLNSVPHLQNVGNTFPFIGQYIENKHKWLLKIYPQIVNRASTLSRAIPRMVRSWGISISCLQRLSNRRPYCWHHCRLLRTSCKAGILKWIVIVFTKKEKVKCITHPPAY